MNKIPQGLRNGSHVRIVSTARKIENEKIQLASQLLSNWGYEVSLGTNISGSHHQFSGTIEERVADLQNALDDDSVGAIWCSRGGYGTVSLIDYLNFDQFKNKPKWIVGYSDVTGLLCHLDALNIASIHGPMPVNLTATPKIEVERDFKSLNQLLRREGLEYSLPTHKLSRPGKMSGKIIGGNLSIIYSILGSKSLADTTGKILFIEDLDEYLYHVDRMMVNVKRNGVLDNLAGVLVGGMTDMNDNDVPFGKTAEEIINDHLNEFNYPVYFGFPAGHSSPNRPIPFGVDVEVRDNSLKIMGL